jgi:hypothetical protein
MLIFRKFPRDLENIIIGYMDDLTMVESYICFYKMYSSTVPNLTNRSKVGQNRLILDIPSALSNLYKNSANVDFSMGMFKYGIRLNGELGERSDPDGSIEIFDREPELYKFPDDLKLFHTLFRSSGVCVYFPPITRLTAFNEYDDVEWEDLHGNPYYLNDVYIKDWFVIFVDCRVDDNYSCLYINLNSDSCDFGHVYSYYMHRFKFVAKSFRETINILINRQSCSSICDHLGKMYCTCNENL